MSYDPQSSPLFTHIDVSTHSSASPAASSDNGTVINLLTHLVAAQDRQNELLEEMVAQMSAAQKQRSVELGQWKEANPRLARNCRDAAESLSNVQTEFLQSLTEEISEHAEDMMEGEFMLNEFVDRYGPRLAHLNGVLQVLSQLGATPVQSNASAK